MKSPIVVGITGGSGACYAVRLVQVLLHAGYDVYFSISTSGAVVIEQELGWQLNLKQLTAEEFWQRTSQTYDLPGIAGQKTEPASPGLGTLHYAQQQNMMSAIASGSFLTTGMVICPCSGSTLSAIAHAMSNNLIQRAAEVHLKERRKLIVVPRETPLSLPTINNMKLITEAGAVVLPASPGFYHGATTLLELVDFIVARICDQLGIEHQLSKRWGTAPASNA